MGGHGGLNILPQKRWNVYNFDNREKVRKDEEEAAREEEVKRDESRKRNFEVRLQQLRQARGIHTAAEVVESKPESEPKSKHINLLEGIKIFDPVEVKGEEDEKRKKQAKKMKKEEVRVVGPEDEKYRLGYGVAGKGVKAPWYATRPAKEPPMEEEQERVENGPARKTKTASNKKTVEELREERIKREKAEKERTRALLLQQQKQKRR